MNEEQSHQDKMENDFQYAMENLNCIDIAEQIKLLNLQLESYGYSMTYKETCEYLVDLI